MDKLKALFKSKAAWASVAGVSILVAGPTGPVIVGALQTIVCTVQVCQ